MLLWLMNLGFAGGDGVVTPPATYTKGVQSLLSNTRGARSAITTTAGAHSKVSNTIGSNSKLK